MEHKYILKKLASTVFLLMLLATFEFIFAQDPPPVVFGPGPVTPGEAKWQTFGNADDEFHARLPKPPSVFLTKRNAKNISGPETARIYATYDEGIVYIIVVYDNSQKAEPFKNFVNEFKNRFFSSWEMKFGYSITMNRDNGEHYSMKKRGVDGAVRFFVKPKHAYMATAVGTDADNPAVKRFLDSFTMWDYPVDKMRGPSTSASAPNNPSTLSTRLDVNSAAGSPPNTADDQQEYLLPGIKSISTPKADADDVPPSAPQNGSATNPLSYYDRTFEQNEVTTKALVVLKPEASYTEEARNNNIEGVVKLSAVLTRKGQVSDVYVVQGLPYGLTERAMKAIRHLIFLPAQKDDHRVSQTITVEYTFSVN